MLKSVTWDPANANVVVFCDACLEGMGFWFPDLDLGFYAPTPMDSPTDIIFYYEALCVVSAIDILCNQPNENQKIVIFTDNSNTVDMFSSLRCEPAFNHLLRFAVDRLLSKGHDLRVIHVSGVENDVADAISRGQVGRALNSRPNLHLQFFRPPCIPHYPHLARHDNQTENLGRKKT